MLDDALEWVGRVLGAPITAHAALDGGLTSTMLVLTARSGRRAVLRLMTEEPWRRHGAELTRRERDAQRELVGTEVPAPASLALDAVGGVTGVAAHVMTLIPGSPATDPGEAEIAAMADMLAVIHDVAPARLFRRYQSWAPPEKWVVPPWTRYPASWRRAFTLLAEGPPEHESVFLHRDFSHRNLLWRHGAISGVVDWVETSSGPRWLDVAHAATNLAMSCGSARAGALLRHYAALTQTRPDPYWLVLDAVGFLPTPPGRPLFGSSRELAGLDEWLDRVIRGVAAR